MRYDDSEPLFSILKGKALVLPLGLAVTVVGFLIFSGWKANAFLTEIQNQNTATRAAVESLRVDMQNQNAARWTRGDMERWAYQLERMNRDAKLNVPDIRMGSAGG